MLQMAFKIAVILTLLLHALFAMEQPETIAHDITPSPKPSDTTALSTLPPEQVRRLLASIEVLNPTQQDTQHVKVKSVAL